MIARKNNSKSVATALLALILCLAIFLAACDGNNPPADTNQNTETTPSPETNVTPEPQNLGAFTVAIPDNGKYNLATENDLVKQKIIDDIVKEKGIQIDLKILALNGDDYINQINSVLSAGQGVECIVDDYSTFDFYMGIGGLCQPIDNLLVEYGQGLLNSIGSDVWNAVTYNNMIYAVPGAALKEETSMYARQDMLDMMGLNKIVTKAEFDASLIAFSALSKKSGVIPLAANYKQALDFMSYLTHSPVNDYIYEYGEYVMREQHRDFPDFLNMLKDYYSKGYLPQDFFDISEDEVSTLFTSGLAMMYITEYTNVAEDYATLLAAKPQAKVELVTKPTHIKMKGVELSAEIPVSQICLFTLYGQNHAALMVYLDWMLSDVENYETAKLGVLGTQINFNNMAHEYQLLGDYEQKSDFYNSFFGLGICHDAVFPPVVPINGDAATMKCLRLAFDSYAHLSTANIVDEGTYNLSEEAQTALSYYRFAMDEAIKKYVTDEIDYAGYTQYLENNKANAQIVLDELYTLPPNGTR